MPMSPAPSGRIAREETIAGVRARVAESRATGTTIGFVPTMGALHAGHVSLIEAARSRCGYVAASIFVNPTQFGPNEDYGRYPRTLEADLAACRAAGADLVFVPSKEEVYPAGSTTFVEVGGLSEILEGVQRPGHFRGVATVVLKLFHMVQPDVAFFGAKDYQQQLVIRRMVRDLDMPIEIVTCATVRESDGLAMSSRNRYLGPDQRGQARSISAALFAARERFRSGENDLNVVREGMRQTIEAAGLTIDYATVADPETLEELREPQRRMVLLAAARLGGVRLIDNVEVTLT